MKNQANTDTANPGLQRPIKHSNYTPVRLLSFAFGYTFLMLPALALTVGITGNKSNTAESSNVNVIPREGRAVKEPEEKDIWPEEWMDEYVNECKVGQMDNGPSIWIYSLRTTVGEHRRSTWGFYLCLPFTAITEATEFKSGQWKRPFISLLSASKKWFVSLLAHLNLSAMFSAKCPFPQLSRWLKCYWI